MVDWTHWTQDVCFGSGRVQARTRGDSGFLLPEHLRKTDIEGETPLR